MDTLPFGRAWDDTVRIESGSDVQEVRADYHFVAGRYFDVLDIDLVRGRLPGPSDRSGGEPVAFVSRSFAERAWPGADPLDRSIQVLGEVEPVSRRVVGVVEDVKQRGYAEPSQLTVYMPHAQGTQVGSEGVRRLMEIVVEPKRRGPAFEMSRLQEILEGLAPNLILTEVGSLESTRMEQAQGRRLALWMLTFLAGLAVAVALTGAMAMLLHLVSRGRKEIALRMSLGATTVQTALHVARVGARRASLGVLFGLLLTVASGRFTRSLVYGVAPWDPWVVAAAVFGIFGMTFFALLPAVVRAARTDPMEMFRSE